ncbi:unnamed protein product [Angiostrongylus costaricensis]|uniref:Zmiz1_N domain-containing protein n=1 Tax=Angiostrongylus costaricensis TaxID=334426 RepID=A0A0R3P9L0_ANGCS|nr:unnamed protein product [Angiostrongylus costaricensis]
MNARITSRMQDNSFPSACTELTQWCADQRAFSSYFEENLLAALQVSLSTSSVSLPLSSLSLKSAKILPEVSLANVCTKSSPPQAAAALVDQSETSGFLMETPGSFSA